MDSKLQTKILLLGVFTLYNFLGVYGGMSQAEKEKAIRSVGMDPEFVEIIDEVGIYEEYVIRSPCQVVLKSKESQEFQVVNVANGVKCNDPRCGRIARSKGVFDQYGDAGICITSEDLEYGIEARGLKVTSRCFCNAGS